MEQLVELNSNMPKTKRKMNTFKNIITGIFFLMPLFAMAQKDLPSGQVDIIKNFDARLLDTEHLKVRPELPPLDTVTRRQIYNILSKTLEVEYLPPRIRPASMKGDEVQKSYNGYAKLGGGFPSSLYADGSYDFFAEDQYSFGIDIHHHSANNNKKIENQRFGFTKLGTTGTYYAPQGFAVNANLGYTIDNVFFYGYNELNEERNTNNTFDSDDVKQQFSTFDLGASIFNGQRTQADFNYHAGFNLYLMQDDFGSKENGFDLNLGATKWFNEKHALRINLRTDFTNYRDTVKQDLNNFYLQPSFTFHGDAFKAKIGANITSHEDEFSFFPDLELYANILGSALGVFVGAEGSLQKNTFRSLSDYSPFISSRISIENTRYFHYYGGVRGNFQGIDYRAQIGYKDTENLALFLTSSDTIIPRFDVLYDTAQIFVIQGSLSFPVLKGLDATGTITQNIFSLDNQEKPWHLPSLTFNAGVRYTTMEGKLIAKADMFLENGVPVLQRDGKTDNLNTLFDISVGADYLFTENIGAFIQINNLANNRRQRWQYYPVFGLNALIGITARF